MTRTQSGANWSGIPSLSQLLLAALLRLTAMFVANAVSTLQMLLSRLPRECHTDATPDRLPAAKDSNSEKAETAAPHSRTHEGLMVSSEQSSRPSNHEGGLNGVCRTARNPPVSNRRREELRQRFQSASQKHLLNPGRVIQHLKS
jgi:hypothetical protein